MICEIIRKKGEKGSGGTRDAFAPGVAYVCGKAARVKLLNLTCLDWRDAAEEMLFTSELSKRVQKPYYHVVLSWPEHEQPSQDQMFDAMEHLLRKLGLHEHQVVIGSHTDTSHAHIHAVVNTVNPVSGKVWSKSNDHQKAELACREIEMEQGWSHDNGRFAFEVTGDDDHQEVQLRRNPEGWKKKNKSRANNRQRPSASDVMFQERHGFVSFSQDIPPALRDRFARIVHAAGDWKGLHMGLAGIGLGYEKYGSGARIRLIGSDEYTKATRFGQSFSIGKLQKRLGLYEGPHSGQQDQPIGPSEEVLSPTGFISNADEKATRSTSFKLTLLRRMYTGIFLDDDIAKQIKFVHLHETPPSVTFVDRAEVTDHGSRISTTKSTAATIATIIAMAKAKGWSHVIPSGGPEFIRQISIAAAEAGLRVSGVPPEIQDQADKILGQVRASERQPGDDADARGSKQLITAAEQDVRKDDTSDARDCPPVDIPRDAPANVPKTPEPGQLPDSKPTPSADHARTDPDGTRRPQDPHRNPEPDKEQVRPDIDSPVNISDISTDPDSAPVRNETNPDSVEDDPETPGFP